MEKLFEYRVNSKGKIEITKYLGKDDCNITKIEIPEEIDGHSVTRIDCFAFNGCTSLKSIIIPDSVTTIGYEAFEKCTSLKSIAIPDSVASIGDNVFEDCTSLTRVFLQQ